MYYYFSLYFCLLFAKLTNLKPLYSMPACPPPPKKENFSVLEVKGEAKASRFRRLTISVWLCESQLMEAGGRKWMLASDYNCLKMYRCSTVNSMSFSTETEQPHKIGRKKTTVLYLPLTLFDPSPLSPDPTCTGPSMYFWALKKLKTSVCNLLPCKTHCAKRGEVA
jgi:hypothetical protein